MPDYGHELAFGTFLSPRSQRPADVVALAQLTERVGLDVATFEDHPYQPALLDTWTVMSWVLAQTETLRVAPNVLNLALRSPAVTARAAATLDRLSGGRLELGVGAGYFYEAIAAMGGPRRTMGQAVDALDEAVDVLRGLWDTSQADGFTLNGDHYRLRGAERGPTPAHDISVWIGSYRPRMLRLTGRKGDGWLPSLPYIPPSEVATSNRVIDDAATAAGRDPREIRRLLNVRGTFSASGRGSLQGPPEQWVEELVALALDHGFSTFLVWSNDPETIQTFGEVVAPAVRDAVAHARADAGTTTSRVRSATALAQRTAAIDYEDIPSALVATAVEPGDRQYRDVRSSYLHRGSPGLILRPESAADVQSALRFARAQEVPLAVRSGGHGVSGRSTNDGGIVIDLSALAGVEVLDRASGRIRLGPGARWGDVARQLMPFGLGMSSGDYGDVGVGGLATAGGVGFLARRHGLTIDHVVAADIVLADGSLARADADEHPDLLWAIRGAGGNFGIVTAFELDAYPVGDVVFCTMTFDASDTATLLERWGWAIESAPRELTSFLSLFATGREPIAQLYGVYAGDDAQAAIATFEPLLELAPLVDQQAQVVPYAAIVAPHGDPHVGQNALATRCGLLEHLTAPAAQALAGLMRSGESSLIQLRSVGGAVNDVPAEATAYAHRTQNFVVNAVGTSVETLNPRWDADVYPHLNGLYLSFETDQRPERLRDAFPGPTLDRLRRLKATYDPDNVFDRNFPIPPAVRTAVP